jgi:uncharacterized protein (DUF433 family)
MDWSDCPAVERVPGKVSGAWLVKGTRIPAQSVVEHADDGYTPEQIAGELFPGMTVNQARCIIDYAPLVTFERPGRRRRD